MLKKILITILFLGESCIAMNIARWQFLDFINTEIAAGLVTIKQHIAVNAEGEGPFKELSSAFIEKFGDCFEGHAVPIPSSYMYSTELFTAAHAIGLAYLKDGQKRESIPSINIALAFFQSVPLKEAFQTERADKCNVDFIEIARKEKENIERRKLEFQQIRDSKPSEFFK